MKTSHLFTVFALLFGLARSAAAGLLPPDTVTWLQLAAVKIKPGNWIGVRRADRLPVEGWLIELVAVGDSQRVILREVSAIPTWLRKERFDSLPQAPQRLIPAEISEIQYHAGGQVRPLALLLGVVAGAMIGWTTAPEDDSGFGPDFDAPTQGALIGGCGGMVAGILVSLAVPATRTIHCR